MDESTFIQGLDCKFPYGDRNAALELADLACRISPNAAFFVADELTRPPASENVEPSLVAAVLDRLEQSLAHPLAAPVLLAARRRSIGRFLSASECMLLLHQIAPFCGQFAALSIAVMSCREENELVDSQADSVQESWAAR